ncbi:hypothetical protein, partial [Urechidicola vernalis]
MQTITLLKLIKIFFDNISLSKFENYLALEPRIKKIGIKKSFLFIGILIIGLGSLQAQVEIDGDPTEWGTTDVIDLPTHQHNVDFYGNGVVDDQFTTGSKDFFECGNIVPQHLVWTFGQTKAKNDIANGAAVVITSPTIKPAGVDNGADDTYLFFAGDRTSNNGDAQIGFWFYLNGTSATIENGEKNGYFTPAHSIGDLLILSDFTGGGKNATVTVYEWVGLNGGGDSGPENQFILRNDIPAGVAENNGGPETVPGTWSYDDPQYETNAFYEGYVNLSDVLQDVTQICDATWLLETRSSQSLTASLDDFVGGQFNLTPTVTVNNDIVCEGGSGSLSIEVKEGDDVVLDPLSDGYSFVWSSSPDDGVDYGNVASISPSPNVTTLYSVVVSGPSGCSPLEPGVGTLTVIPSTQTYSDSYTICAGDSWTFSYDPDGQGSND